MAITKVGLTGAMTAYGAFSPKEEAQITFAVTALIGTNVVSVELVGTSVASHALTGTVPQNG